MREDYMSTPLSPYDYSPTPVWADEEDMDVDPSILMSPDDDLDHFTL